MNPPDVPLINTGPTPGQSSHRTLACVLFLCSLIISLLALVHILGLVRYTEGWQLSVASTSAIWLTVFVLCAYAKHKTLYLFSNFYVAMLALFHLGVTYSDAFGLFPDVRWHNSTDPWLIQANWYSVFALACFGTGFTFTLPGKRPIPTHAIRNPALRSAHSCGIGLFACSLLLLSFAILSLGNLLAYSRSDFFQGVGDTRALGVFLMIFPSALILLLLGAATFRERILAALLATAGFVLLLLSGYRTSALYPLILTAILWVKTGRPIPRIVATFGILLIAFSISAVGMLRLMGSYQSLDSEDFKESIEKSSIKDTFVLGQTSGLLAHVLRLVPDQYPFRYGMTHINSIKDSIPNVTSAIQESPRVTAMRRSLLNRETLSDLPPSDWLTYHVAHWAFTKGHGVGFTSIGESYLNFGIIGVMVFFLLFGYLLGKLDNVDLSRHPMALVFSSSLLWHFIRTVRDDMGNFYKPALFTLIILLVWSILFKPFSSPHNASLKSG